MPACSSQFAKERRASYGFTPSPDRLSAERSPQTVSRGGSISTSRGTRRLRPRRFVPFTCSRSSSTAHLSEKYSSGPIPVQQRSHQIRPASPPRTSALLRGGNPGPVSAAVVTPAIEEPERSVAQLLQDVEPACIAERAAHGAEVFDTLCVVRSRRPLDPDATERPLQNVGALTV